MHAAAQLATAAPTSRQQRILARYVLLHADSVQRWIGRWKTELERSPGSRELAHKAKTPIRRFRQEYAKQKEIRDRLAVRRQAADSRRANDLRRTVVLWKQLTEAGVNELCGRAETACRSLGSTAGFTTVLGTAELVEARSALLESSLDENIVYTDATSYGAGERNLLTATEMGPVGRRVTQINDVHDQLDLLYALRNMTIRTDSVGLLLRSALIVEVTTLIELSIGPPASKAPNRRDGTPLIALLNRDRGEEGADLLNQFASEIVPSATHINLRDLRDRVAAHLDTQLSLDKIVETLRAVDMNELFRSADVALDWLDAVARTHVDLGMLVIGHRQIASLKPRMSPTRPPFEMEQFTDILDAPYGAIAGGGFGARGTGGLAGIVAGRAKSPRRPWMPDRLAEAEAA